MAVQKANGTAVSRSTLISGSTDGGVAGPTTYTMTEDIYQTYTGTGETAVEGEKRLLFRNGQKITSADLDAAYPAATGVSISPSGKAHAGTLAFTLKVKNGRNLSGVKFGTVSATSVVYVREDSFGTLTITGVAPAQAGAGAVDVKVTQDGADVIVLTAASNAWVET